MRLAIVGLLAAGAAWAQPKGDLKFFINGAGVALHTESSNKVSPLSTTGSVIVSKGPAFRVVLDAENRALFAYNIDLRKLADGRVLMRIEPLDVESARTEKWYPRIGAVPTLASARQFPPLNVGDEVQVDIMVQPSTGEKLWDVLRVIDDRNSYPGAPRAGNRFSFDRFQVTIDGKTVAERQNAWMIGQALRMTIPGRGDYFLMITPPADFPFEASGWVDHNVLRFRAGGEQVEFTGKSNILQQSDYGTVWVYYLPNHDRGDRRMTFGQVQVTAAAAAAGAAFICGDNMDQIYPAEERKGKR